MRSSFVLACIAALALGACGKDEPKGKPQPASALPAAPADARRVAITVGKTGYLPNTIEAAAGEQLVLVFTRTADTECGRYVQIKGTDLKAELPLDEPVEVPVTMPASGEVVFACHMDMMHGIVSVTPSGG